MPTPNCSRKKTTERRPPRALRPAALCGRIRLRPAKVRRRRAAGAALPRCRCGAPLRDANARTASLPPRSGCASEVRADDAADVSTRAASARCALSPPRDGGISCALWRSRAVATRHRRCRRGGPLQRRPPPRGARGDGARMPRRMSALATASARAASANRIKRGVFSRIGKSGAASRECCGHARCACSAHAAPPATAAAATDRGNFFATGC